MILLKVVLLMTAKGKECCEALKEPEKAIIGLRNLELIMLSVGESEPPEDWQETFKIIPETEEERYARLTGIRLKRNGQVKRTSGLTSGLTSGFI